LADRERHALARLITLLGPLPPIGDLSIAAVLEAVRRDKKVVHGTLHFVLATAVGASTIVNDVSEDELEAALARLGLRG
jgi:3-dehydroquinate synthetase